MAEEIWDQICGKAALHLAQSPAKEQKAVPSHCGSSIKSKCLKAFHVKSIKCYFIFNLIIKKIIKGTLDSQSTCSNHCFPNIRISPSLPVLHTLTKLTTFFFFKLYFLRPTFPSFSLSCGEKINEIISLEAAFSKFKTCSDLILLHSGCPVRCLDC